MHELQPIEYVDVFTWLTRSSKKNPNMRLIGRNEPLTKRQTNITTRQNNSVKTIEPKPKLFDWEKEI